MKSQPNSQESVVGGRYHVERMLGEGGMGIVYRARDASTGQWLALKQLRGKGDGTRSALFEREYRTLASLRHPRIVQVYEFGNDPSGAFYTMELLEGGDLSLRAPLPWRQVCACLRDAASILGVLHARRLVHRDLSPRNLWQTPDGRLKLLDFGAVAPFGPATEVVGTPAFVAPEVLDGRALDQRTDLFALGALGYWLLTSTHAFRAGSFVDLPRLWEKAPAAPSNLAKLVQGADRDIPPALDQLILSLLRLDPDERPRGTADLVDHLNAVAGLKLELEDVVVEGYLESSAFVGRVRERDRFAAALARANLGQPQGLLIEGPEGSGKSRLLAELAIAAQIAGATTITTRATAGGRPYEAATALVRALLAALPQEARLAAKPHLRALGALAPDLIDRPSWPSSLPNEAAPDRAHKQTALASCFFSLARERTLLVICDDLHAADEESQALIATLVRADVGHRLLVVGAVRTDLPEAHQATLRGIRSGARVLPLAPLEPTEVREMLRSVFGEVRYLERLSARLHKISGGSPSHTLMLARHLVRSGSARYEDGAWTLQPDLPADLPSTLRAGVVSALASLPAEARRLARLASVPHHGALTSAMLAALGGTDRAISVLLDQHLLSESEHGLQLAHPALAEALRLELTADESTRAHLIIAQGLEHQQDLSSRVCAALHLLHAGEWTRGELGLLGVSRRIVAGEHEALRAAAPMFAEALQLLEDAGRAPSARIPLLSVLAVAGYQVDRSYALRYGDQALAALQQALCFRLASRAKPLLGGLLSLLLALGVATIVLRVRRRPLRTLELVTWLVTITGFLMGPASLCLERDKLRRYAKLLEPLLALGKDHGVSLVHRFCLGLGSTLEDRGAAPAEHLKPVIDRLLEPAPIRALPERNRRNLLASALYSYGLRETLACDSHVLETTAMLARFSAMHAMQADQLRWLYHCHRGEPAQAEVYAHSLELEAIQQGIAWQAELLMPRHQARIAIWTQDAATNRRASASLARLAHELPSFVSYERRARAVDLYLRGQYEEALPLLEVTEVPLAHLGWTSMRALLAHVYGARGEHKKAKAVCIDALARLTDDDRRYVVMSLPIEVELALAEAGLGAHHEAEAQLVSLLAAHADKGALVRGSLHSARARVALLAGNLALAEQQIDATDACYRPTRLPSLLMHSGELRAELRRAQRPVEQPDAPLREDDGHLLTRVQLLMTSRRADNDDRAEAALHVALELTFAEHGFIVYADTKRVVHVGDMPSEALVDWACERLLATSTEDERTVVTDENESPQLDVCCFDGVHHRITILRRLEGHLDRPIAALALGSPAALPAAPTAAVLRVIGDRL